ncbi:unnamed protein product [Polarella glacialis]|uniref:Uncharacterized protein n=1 Tax=Polarella glacialis TaxID=89957 RepID=A0A813G1B9_POLGL|nr:unnamed protein product [Polarella glacialis]CAE8618145.1 unnamed protein product [Polarella glacialis]
MLQKAVLLPESHPVIQAAIGAGKEFHSSKVNDHKSVRNPHLWVWRAVMTTAAALDNATGTDKIALLKHISESSTPETLEPLVFHCRVNQTFADKSVFRLCFVVASSIDPVLDSLLKVLIAEGGKLLITKPPRSSLERSLLKQLQAMGEWTSSSSNSADQSMASK